MSEENKNTQDISANTVEDTESVKTEIDGHTFSDMVISAANALDNDKNQINDLNVFPVPDGDTGINMSKTLEGPANELDKFDGSLSDVASKTAATSLRSARGNSGAILSLFLRGMAKSLEGKETADSEAIAEAFEKGTEEAYKAVSQPMEGTILTVMRACSEEASAMEKKPFGQDIKEFFEKIIQVAEETLAKTPEMLTALKQANVVDAGGKGFVTMLKGMYAALRGEPVGRQNTEDGNQLSAAAGADGSDEAIKFAYCTEVIVDKDKDHFGDGTGADLRDYIEKKGDSVVFVDDESFVKLHVHTNHPGKVIEHALALGTLTMVKVENMRLQHSELIEKPEDDGSKPIRPYIAKPEKKYGFATVCMGDGIVATFKDLGVDSIIFGGQTMNPSTQDLLDAINRTPSEIVYLLPNNKNICMVAEQAAMLATEKRVIVVPTISVPQGIAALMNIDETLEPEELAEAMRAGFESITSMSITYAVRDTTVENREIKKGEAIGLINGKIRYVGETSLQCFKTMTKKMQGASYVTVFVGKDVEGPEMDEKIRGYISAVAPEAEILILNGGQPLYDFLISVEK